MIKELQLRILPEEAVNEQSLRQVVARETGEAPKNIRAVRVLKRSIDACLLYTSPSPRDA